MNVIYKYVITGSAVALGMPKGSKVLSVHGQGDSICLWAMVNTDMLVENRNFIVGPTGVPISEPVDKLIFLGTVVMHEEQLVFHVFELTL